MSKLYTEEQLHKLIFKYRQQLTEFSFNKPTVQNLIDELTPIELPTDEEIWNEYNSKGENLGSNFAFARGAEWMRDKIKGGGQ
jgi:hypothetical protein